MRKNLHPGCSCFMCKRGKFRYKKNTARKVRRVAQRGLHAIRRGNLEAEVQTVVSGGYTD